MNISSWSIDKINFNNRAKNALHRADIHTVGDMLSLTEDKLYSFNNIGEKTVKEILDKIEECKLYIQNGSTPSIAIDKAENKSVVEQIDFDEWILDENNRNKVRKYLESEKVKISMLELLPVLAYNRLLINGYNYLYQIVFMSAENIMQISRMDSKSADEILNSVKRYLDSNKENIINNCVEKKITEEIDFANHGWGIYDYYQMPEYEEIILAYAKLNDKRIDQLGLSNRPKNRLSGQGYTLLSEILFLNQSELQQIPAMGNNSIEEIINAIHHYLETNEKRLVAFIEGDESVLFDDESIKNNILELYLEKPFIGYSFSEFKEALNLDTRIDDVRLKKIIGELLSSGNLEYVDFRCYRIYPRFIDYFSECSSIDSREKEVLSKRLNGHTLEEVGKDLNVTRERIRQIEKNALQHVKKYHLAEDGYDVFDEDYYKYFYATYEFDKKDAEEWLGIEPQTYFYLRLNNDKQGKKNLDLALSDVANLDAGLRLKIKNFLNRNKIFIDGRWIEKKRSELEPVLIKLLCVDEISFEQYGKRYNEFLKESEIKYDEKIYFSESVLRARENIIRDSKYVLWKQNKRMRYYDIDSRDYTELLDVLNLKAYKNIEISTLKFMNDYPELMERYDIHDQYELHNLLKKIINPEEYNDIDFTRMPIIRFGEFDRAEACFNLMINNAPISYYDLCNIIRAEYGFEPGAIQAALESFSKYYHKGVYTIDQKVMPVENVKKLATELTEDFYYLDEIKDIYLKAIPNADIKDINSYNLKGMGFNVYNNCAVQNCSSKDEYFEKLLRTDDVIDISVLKKRYTYIQAFSLVLMKLKRNLDVIEFEPDQLIGIKKLENAGITRENLQDFCDQVYEWVGDNEYFSIKKIVKDGFYSELFELGSSEWFYSNVLVSDSRFSFSTIFGNLIFYKGQRNLLTKDFVLDIVKKAKIIDAFDLMSVLTDTYGCRIPFKSVPIEKISDTEVYYDKILDRLYANIDLFYQDLEENGGI